MVVVVAVMPMMATMAIKARVMERYQHRTLTMEYLTLKSPPRAHHYHKTVVRFTDHLIYTMG